VPGGGPEARRLGWQPNALRRALGSGADREAIAAAMLLGEASDAVMIGNQRAGEADGCGDQQPVRRIALFKVMKLIAARSGKVIKRHRLDARAIDEALDPSLGWKIEVDAAYVSEQRNLPSGYGAQKKGAAIFPTGRLERGSRGVNNRRRYRARGRCACRAKAHPSPLDLAACLGIRRGIESRRDEVHAPMNPHRTPMRAE